MNILDLIGNTPLIDLSFLSSDKKRIKLFAKAEWVNPGGSLKDRPVKYMLSHAISNKQLTSEKTILDSSSGNAGISYGMIGVQPEHWPGIEGLKPLGEENDIVPGIFDPTLVDEWYQISSDNAKQRCSQMAQKGIFVGQSSGAYLEACCQLISELTEGTVTTLLCDLGERYFSAGLWDYDSTY